MLAFCLLPPPIVHTQGRFAPPLAVLAFSWLSIYSLIVFIVLSNSRNNVSTERNLLWTHLKQLTARCQNDIIFQRERENTPKSTPPFQVDSFPSALRHVEGLSVWMLIMWNVFLIRLQVASPAGGWLALPTSCAYLSNLQVECAN